jgi:transcriptional regulator with GAF, ATPase, and Fis domain
LIKVCCGDLPDKLVEAELFGHEKGAFPGALRQRRGRFELAHKGTLLLDDIDALPATVQKKMWQLLQDRKCLRIGGRESMEVDVRVLCASQEDLKDAVAHGFSRSSVTI